MTDWMKVSKDTEAFLDHIEALEQRIEELERTVKQLCRMASTDDVVAAFNRQNPATEPVCKTCGDKGNYFDSNNEYRPCPDCQPAQGAEDQRQVGDDNQGSGDA